MSLLGIKDMELIEDPPEDRYPVRTFVSEERPDVIAESIRRELDRGGQVYVVFNRVDGIERVAEQLRALMLQARIAVCHAKMSERMIEDVMQDFYANEYDVLLSTTIIESGLDIPNVNTIIILDADRLGLTQLYQLRGRVGRTNKIAYAYLLYRRDKALTGTAEKRLRTIREFTEFGSGFKIAMKDLEIRGAGNLLGVSQHGHMASVGYEMYCKMMDEAVAALAGHAPARADGESECRVELSVSAVIPPGYIDDEIVKLQAYKRISFVGDEDTKAAVLEELRDRFGPVPASVLALINAAYLRHLGEAAGLAEVKLTAKRAVLAYRDAPPNLAERVFKASECAHKKGAAIEADIKGAPKLKLALPTGASDEERFEAVRSVLSALG
jgi:transcription-repair coupling factor (superfamily II helicase)